MTIKRFKILDSAYFNQDVIITGTTYNLLFKFNSSDESWYLSIRDSLKNSIVSGIKIMPNQNLTKRFEYLNVFKTGDIWCVRKKNDFTPINRNNLGIDKSYEVAWISGDSLSQEYIDAIQL